MTKKIVLSVLIVSVLALAGCETSKGVGRDVENTGKNIQKTVD
jgi:predicted small secreted protein